MRVLFVLIVCALVFSAEILVDVPVLAVGSIIGKEYAISDTWLYRKTDVFRPVYQLPTPITAARFGQDIIETPQYVLHLASSITVVQHKNKVSSGLWTVPIAFPVHVLATANNAVIVAYNGLQLARETGRYLKLIPLQDLSADQLEALRLTYINQKKNMITRADHQYLRMLYKLETEKRREGPRDAYPITIPK